MNVIVLHNSEDKASREFVASIPKDDGNTYCIIDWYKQPEEIKSRTCPCHLGQPYKGPDPSAFPELVYEDLAPADKTELDAKTGELVKVAQDPGWVRIRKAQSMDDVKNPGKVDARKPLSVEEKIQMDAEIKKAKQDRDIAISEGAKLLDGK